MRISSRTAAGLLAVAMTAACTPEDSGRISYGPKPLFDPIVLPTSSTGSPIVPLPIDLLYGTDANTGDDNAVATDIDDNLDGTLNLAGLLGEAALVGAGQVDGWSTTAALFTDLVGPLDLSRAADGVRIFDAVRFRELVPGEDFLIEASPVIFGRTRLLVQWLKPLPESTRFLVALTSDIVGPDGSPGIRNEVFALLSNETAVSQQASSILQSLQIAGRSSDIAVLESIQQRAILPVVAGIEGLSAAAPNSRGAISRGDMLLAWSFTTQSITPTINKVVAGLQPSAIGVQDSGLDMSQVLSQAAGAPVSVPVDADVYAGTVDLPYYLSTSPAEINRTFFVNNGSVEGGVNHPGLSAPCGALLRPTSTTICYPTPQVRSTQTVPVVLTRPQLPMPSGGWPVAVFAHGITGDRSQIFGIAPALAAAGIVTVAIDHPLHGVPPGSPLRIPGVGERTFDVDLNQDGTPDSSGAYFINLQSTLSTRDNGRQAVIDQLQLIASLGNVRLGDGSETLNTDRIAYVGYSLGALVGSGVHAASDDLAVGVLAFPSGMITKLLDGSETFGPIIAAGLEAAGVTEGTDSYENFLLLAQTAIDAGDPINFAAQVANAEPVLVLEVEGDAVVPNTVVDNPQAIQNGYLAGTRVFAEIAGLVTTTVNPGSTGAQIRQGSNHVLLTAGTHASFLRPSTPNPRDDAAFVELQNEAAQFIASGGLCLPIATNCPQP